MKDCPEFATQDIEEMPSILSNSLPSLFTTKTTGGLLQAQHEKDIFCITVFFGSRSFNNWVQ